MESTWGVATGCECQVEDVTTQGQREGVFWASEQLCILIVVAVTQTDACVKIHRAIILPKSILLYSNINNKRKRPARRVRKDLLTLSINSPLAHGFRSFSYLGKENWKIIKDAGSESFCPKTFRWSHTKEYTNVCIKTSFLLGRGSCKSYRARKMGGQNGTERKDPQKHWFNNTHIQ